MLQKERSHPLRSSLTQSGQDGRGPEDVAHERRYVEQRRRDTAVALRDRVQHRHVATPPQRPREEQPICT